MDEIRGLVDHLESRSRIIRNPSYSWLKAHASKYAIKNDFGIPLFHSRVCARMPDATIDDVNKAPGDVKAYILAEINELKKYIMGKTFIAVDRAVGISRGFRVKVRAYVSSRYPHLALMFAVNYFQPSDDDDYEIVTIDVPEWPRKLVLVDPVERATVILGSDYYGELKMSALRMAMNYARDYMGLLGVHAATKVYYVHGGRPKGEGFLIFGLSGTGKSTITFHLHEGDLRDDERVAIRQDDINIVNRRAHAYATEENFYPKTDSAPSIPNLMKALHHQDTILENVAVKNGVLDFRDTSGCHSNARAIAIRHAIEGADLEYDTERVTKIIFLTRRHDMPVAARVSSIEQATAYFMLGESIKTSAGTMDPREVGKPVRVPGFDPFIIGPKWLNGLRFYEILYNNPDIQVYVLNTGYIGNTKITPEYTLKTVLAIARGDAVEDFDENLNMYRIVSVPGLDLGKLDPYKHIPGYAEHIKRIRDERANYLASKFKPISFISYSI
ncbi:MAG: phosphoenolpyruvate carboxykinase [Desulfurococcales archaeon]|nr:phosphoenolpyruvate carboxykinase [Desulfurococcales archaeon]